MVNDHAPMQGCDQLGCAVVQSDADLLRALRSGDQRAAAQLIDRYHAWALEYARKKGAGQDARDIAHDVLVALLESPPEDLHSGSLHALLSARLRFRVLDSQQRRREGARELSSKLRANETAPSDRARRRRAARQAVEALDQLCSTERRLLRMRYIDDMRAVDIAESTGQSAAAVRSALFRARASLRMLLGLGA